MSDVRPHGATKDAQYVFSKIHVHDLNAMAKFYEAVFGLVPFNRHQDSMFGRKIDEITDEHRQLVELGAGGADDARAIAYGQPLAGGQRVQVRPHARQRRAQLVRRV